MNVEPTHASAIDPVTLEIQWSRLVTVMDETDFAVVRTSFSTIVGESRDFAVIVLDRLGRSIAQSQLSSTAFTVTLPATTKHLLEAFPVATLRFAEERFPGHVTLTAFNPLIPLNDADSSIPAAFFSIEVDNVSDQPLTYTICAVLGGALGGALGGLIVAPFGVRLGYKLMDWRDRRAERW